MALLRFLLLVFTAAVFTAPGDGSAQMNSCPGCRTQRRDIAELIERADRLHAEFKPNDGAVELRKVLQLDPGNLEALAKLSRAHIDIGDLIPETQPNWKEQRIREYRTAENYARQAIKADPDSTWGHFYLAASLGMRASVSPVAEQVEMAEDIRAATETAIRLDPANGFAYHVYGVWHRRMAEIGRTQRAVASLWYGRTLPHGDLDKSLEYLKKAVAINPNLIVSRLELARTHAARHDWAEARAQLDRVAQLPIKFSDDAKHKQQARELQDEIKDR
jgi:tetratricopeptide (TPR) repeat protein